MILWAMPDSGAKTKEDYAEFIALFKKENPTIDISVRVFTRNVLWRRMFTIKHPTHEEEIPDVVQVPNYWTALLIKEGIAENLSQLDPSLSLADVFPALKPQCFLNGTKDIYSYPWWFDVSALHFRVDHLKSVTSHPEKDLATWDGFLQVCQALQEKYSSVPGYYPVQNSDWRGSLSMRNALPCVWGKGADLLTEDGQSTQIGTKGFRDGLRNYFTLALKEYMPILRERGSLGTMVSGKASMMISRKNGYQSFAKKGLNVCTVPVPATGEIAHSYLAGMNFFINVLSQHKKDALAFIKFCSRPDIQLKYAKMIGVFPAFMDPFNTFIEHAPKRFKKYPCLIASARTLPSKVIVGTIMEILKRVLAICAAEIVEKRFTPSLLDRELAEVVKEVEYLISIYER